MRSPFEVREWIDDTHAGQYVIIFGDNCLREGYGGMAKLFRDSPHAIGVRTKMKPARTSDSYFNDKHRRLQMTWIRSDFQDALDLWGSVATYEGILIPANLGLGLSEMDKRCPETYAAMSNLIRKLCETEWNPQS